MRVTLTRLILLAVSLLVVTVTVLRAKNTERAPVNASGFEKPTNTVDEEAVSDEVDEAAPVSAVAEPVMSGAKADWIEKALATEDSELKAKGKQLLREMVSQGTVSDVLAALPKATFFSEEIAHEIAALQSTLCRFQDSDDLAFEMIKLKFNLVFKRQAAIKPWPAICRAG